MVKSRMMSGSGLALACALAMLAIGGKAQAADYLRGAYSGETEPRAAAGPDWGGVYGGVHAGISSGQTDPRPFSPPLARAAIPNTVITDTVASLINFKETNKLGTSYGAFAGINWLWDDVVLGLEVDYTRSSIKSNSTSSGSATLKPTGTTDEYDITTNAVARARLSDWGTLRGRVGWAAGMFMPYLTAGVAFGNVDGRANMNGTWARYDVSTPPARTFVSSGTFSGAVGRRGITYGGAMGAGVDMQIVPNTFLRAEWQYIQFASGGQRPNVSINTARIAGGVKF
jgi:outer membrane immunogenic protein